MFYAKFFSFIFLKRVIMRRFYSKVSSIALLLCLTTQTVFSMEEGRPAPRVAVAAPSLASPSCLKLSNIEAMRAWISKTEEFILLIPAAYNGF